MLHYIFNYEGVVGAFKLTSLHRKKILSKRPAFIKFKSVGYAKVVITKFFPL